MHIRTRFDTRVSGAYSEAEFCELMAAAIRDRLGAAHVSVTMVACGLDREAADGGLWSGSFEVEVRGAGSGVVEHQILACNDAVCSSRRELVAA